MLLRNIAVFIHFTTMLCWAASSEKTKSSTRQSQAQHPSFEIKWSKSWQNCDRLLDQRPQPYRLLLDSETELLNELFLSYSECPSMLKSDFLFLFRYSASSDSNAVARMYPRTKRGDSAKIIWFVGLKRKRRKIRWGWSIHSLSQNAMETSVSGLADRSFNR